MDRLTIFNLLWVHIRDSAAKLRRQDGAALAEYGLLIGFILAACVVAVTLFGTRVVGLFVSAGGI